MKEDEAKMRRDISDTTRRWKQKSRELFKKRRKRGFDFKRHMNQIKSGLLYVIVDQIQYQETQR